MTSRLPLAAPQPHHDGSALYVPEPPAELGDEVTVRLRVPQLRPSTRSRCATSTTASPAVAGAMVDEETETRRWWRATFPVVEPGDAATAGSSPAVTSATPG